MASSASEPGCGSNATVRTAAATRDESDARSDTAAKEAHPNVPCARSAASAAHTYAAWRSRSGAKAALRVSWAKGQLRRVKRK